jgi:hypothetical protein
LQRYLLLLLLFGVFEANSQAQEISAHFKQKPLSEAIIEIRDTYGLYFAFNEDELSKYKITVFGRFINVESFLDEALEGLPFTYSRNGLVILIVPTGPGPQVSEFTLHGQVIDKLTGESLPNSHVFINSFGMLTDLNGHFTFVSNTDSVFKLKVSYLGYYIYDTAVVAGMNIKIGLMPSLVGLNEVVVKGREIDFSSQIGGAPGEVKLNHMVAKFLPGYGDNTVFNLMRLQPGIMAAGEQSGYFTIWGSSEGQNQVLFDGFTVFGLNNFNDQISTINPFMVKDIEIIKGGYGADYGDKAGAMVHIRGIEGDRTKPTVNLLVNNLTLNGMASVPIAKKSAFSLAFRQTYYNLYNAADFDLPETRTRNGRQVSEVNVVPSYNFRDANVKYSGETPSGDPFFVSGYYGGDRFGFNLESDTRLNHLESNGYETNEQQGFSAMYNKLWTGHGSSRILFSYSSSEMEMERTSVLTRRWSGRALDDRQRHISNHISEYGVNLENNYAWSSNNHFTWGGNYKHTNIAISEDTNRVNLLTRDASLDNLALFIINQIKLAPKLQMEMGVRVNFTDQAGNTYAQPRAILKYSMNDNWSASAAWGLYNQFVVKSIVVDRVRNRHYIWTISDGKTFPVVQSVHHVVNINHEKDGFEMNLEGYYKSTNGITRFVFLDRLGRFKLNLEAESYGLDLYLKRDFGRHSAWIAYSLGKSTESYLLRDSLHETSALHDQRHELKTAVLVNFNPVYLSSNYVFGSGFSDPYGTPYSRFDVSVIYRFNSVRFKLETGVSILNLFNTTNVKYDDLYRVPDDLGTIDVSFESVPFTPSVFLNIGF